MNECTKSHLEIFIWTLAVNMEAYFIYQSTAELMNEPNNFMQLKPSKYGPFKNPDASP